MLNQDATRRSYQHTTGATGRRMYTKTPLVESRHLTTLAGGTPVYLKLENTQPSGSFKLRGISNIIQKKLNAGCTRLVASSGGNAGMAAAYVARHLNVPLTLYVPLSTDDRIKDKLRAEGASVIAHGAVWNDADAMARQEATNPEVAYIPPFDHPNIWEGHGSLIDELVEQLVEVQVNGPPDLIIVSVGGGGLLIGAAHGMERVGWNKVPILAMETVGADCFNAAVQAGKIVTLPTITSVASCLGALTVAERAFELYNTRPILSELITDRDCIRATCQFLDDHRFLVEPACGAAVGAVYGGLIQRLQSEGKLPVKMESGIVIVVCGGISVTQDMLTEWKTQFQL